MPRKRIPDGWQYEGWVSRSVRGTRRLLEVEATAILSQAGWGRSAICELLRRGDHCVAKYLREIQSDATIAAARARWTEAARADGNRDENGA